MRLSLALLDGLGNLFSWNPVGLTLSWVLLPVLIKYYETNLMNLLPISVNQIKQSGQQNSIFIANFTGSQDNVTTWGWIFLVKNSPWLFHMATHIFSMMVIL